MKKHEYTKEETEYSLEEFLSKFPEANLIIEFNENRIYNTNTKPFEYFYPFNVVWQAENGHRFRVGKETQYYEVVDNQWTKQF